MKRRITPPFLLVLYVLSLTMFALHKGFLSLTFFQKIRGSSRSVQRRTVFTTTMAFSGPVALNVKLSVKPDRRDAFLAVIQKDAMETIRTEPGSLQFTIGEDTTTDNCFYLHEQYRSMDDFEFHKATPHFKEWKAFCGTDPFTAEEVVNIYQCDGERVVATDTSNSNDDQEAFCLNVELCIQPEVREEFLRVIAANQAGSRAEPLCYQYDYGESVDTPNSFYFHEQYKGKEGFDAHAVAPHFLVWETFAAKDPFSKPPVVEFFKSVVNAATTKK